MKLRVSVFNVLAGSSLLALASAADAQTASGAGATPTTSSTLEEIIVTARRKSESIEDVPQVVNAVTSETLARYNIQSFQDVAALVPGLTLSNDGTGYQAKAAIRGVNFEINSATTPTVAFYMNEVVIDANFLLQSMFDVGQIEVLRGPQGTLRGRSSPSGAITVTTHKADLSGIGGYVAGTWTNQDQVKGEGAFNLPIIHDMLAIRFAGLVDDNQFDHVTSINDPDKPHQHTSAERVSLTFTPSDTFTFTGMYQRLERKLRYYQQLAGSGALGAATPGGCSIQGAAGNTPVPCPPAGYNGPVLTPEDRIGVQNQALPVATKYDIITGQADYRFAGQKLSYVGGYSNQNVDSNAYTDSANMLPAGQAQMQHTVTRQSEVSHELRLTSEERVMGLFDYTVGAFYDLTKPDINLPWPVNYLSGAFGSPFGLPSTSILDQRYLIHTDTGSHSHAEERSGFGSITWHIDDKTEVTAGGRYIIVKADGTLNVAIRSDGIIAIPAYLPAAFGGLGLPPTLPPPAPPGIPTPCSVIPGAGHTYGVLGNATLTPSGYTCDLPSSAIPQLQSGTVLSQATDNRWTPKVYNLSLSHHFTDEFLAYANYGTAWRRGTAAVGIQTQGNDPVVNRFVNIDPEESKGYELGFKSNFLDKRARVNLAVYQQKFDGFIYLTPLTSYLADNGAQPANIQLFQFTTNVPATVKGVDLDTLFLITSHWNAGMGVSYADGHMEGASIPCNDSNNDGVPDNNPVTTASFAPGQHIHLCNSNNSIATAPKWNANLTVEGSMSMTSSMDSYARLLGTYYPTNNRASGEDSGFTADSYAILNLYAGVRSSDGAWDVQLFVKNLTNTNKALTYAAISEKDPVGPVNQNFGDSGYFRTSLTPLREVGVTVRYAFGSR